MPNAPYEAARLVNGDKPLTTRWYIIFYTWHAEKKCLVRKRDYSVNKFTTKAQRLSYAKKRIAAINNLLYNNYYIDPKAEKNPNPGALATNKDYSIEQSFKYIIQIVKQTKRPETYTSYNSVGGIFLNFCKESGWLTWKVDTLQRTDIIAWLDSLQAMGSKVGNQTRNNYKMMISALFGLMKERGIIEHNPAFGIKELKADIASNTAYTPDQISILKPAIKKKELRLWLYITFMLYGFIRPAEIERMQISMIDLEKNAIHLPGNITKNHKPRLVTISRHFKNYIEQLGLTRFPANCYVFGFDLQSCDRKIQKNLVNNLHREILRDLGFSAAYGRYSWKHTGVINHYKAGIDIKTLQAQIGHQSLHETDIYLRSLNLYKNTEIEDKSPEI